MPINVFRSMSHSLRNGKGITARTATFQQVNDWMAYKLYVSEPSNVNGFVFNLSAVPTGSMDVSVGISTSLGPTGLFPYVISQEFMNSNVGTAKTIAFEYEISTTINTSSSGGTGYTFMTFISSATGYTLQPNNYYWVGMKVNSVGTPGSFLTYDMASFTSQDNIMASTQSISRFQRLASASATTVSSDFIMAIPFDYNASIGKTTYHMMYPFSLDEIERTFNYAASPNLGREFGPLFELNNFPFQDWEVYSMNISFMRYQGTGNVQDPEFCMRIYDGPDYVNVVGTALTLNGYDFQPTLSNLNSLEFEFIFNPPVKLRSNKTYFAGIAFTYPTQQPSGNSDVFFPYNYRDLTSDQSSVLAFRSTIGSGALTEVTNACVPLNFNLKRTNSVSRAIGN